MKHKHVLMALIAVILLTFSLGQQVLADDQPPQTISPYWHQRVQQWGDLIVQEANSRNIDPDLVASLLWMESRGDHQAVGPVGAVGLLQIMPKEEGFTWRPTREALMNPETNLFWGTRTLATIIKQGKGDIFNSLAAYNGGWEQTMYRGPTIFATTILRDYAIAVHMRYDYGDSWIAYFAVKSSEGIGYPIWIADSRRTDVYQFDCTTPIPEDLHLIPDVAYTARVAAVNDEEQDLDFEVGIWLYDIQTGSWIVENGNAIPSVYEPVGVHERTAGDCDLVVEAKTVVDDSAFEESVLPNEPEVPDVTPTPVSQQTPTPEPDPIEGNNAQVIEDDQTWYGITAVKAVLRRNPEIVNAPQPNDAPATEVETVATCAWSDLASIAYPLNRENTIDGWRVLIYAEGIGGNCVYDYAWNVEDNVMVSGASTANTFWVTSPDRGRPLVGTVLVISGNEVVRVPLYIEAPE